MARGKVVTASNVSINKVTAYNVKTKTKGDPMKVTSVVKYAITKDGEKTGKFRYQLKGKSKSDGTGMSRMVGADDAVDYAKQLGTAITTKEPKAKTAKKPRKTCKELAAGYEDRCNAKRSLTETAKKSVAKKPAPKKVSVKKVPIAKKPAAKKASVAKESRPTADDIVEIELVDGRVGKNFLRGKTVIIRHMAKSAATNSSVLSASYATFISNIPRKIAEDLGRDVLTRIDPTLLSKSTGTWIKESRGVDPRYRLEVGDVSVRDDPITHAADRDVDLVDPDDSDNTLVHVVVSDDRKGQDVYKGKTALIRRIATSYQKGAKVAFLGGDYDITRIPHNKAIRLARHITAEIAGRYALSHTKGNWQMHNDVYQLAIVDPSVGSRTKSAARR